jgi:hypothetical protein
MPRNITITFNDGTSHRYENIPDSVTPDMIEARVNKDFPGKKITNIDGGRKTSNWETGSQKLIYKNYTEEQLVKSVQRAKEGSLIRNLKDPESAKFRNLEIWEVPEKTKSESKLMLTGEINSKNSYGAYGGYNSFYSTGVELSTGIDFLLHGIGGTGGSYGRAVDTVVNNEKTRGKLIWSGN